MCSEKSPRPIAADDEENYNIEDIADSSLQTPKKPKYHNRPPINANPKQLSLSRKKKRDMKSATPVSSTSAAFQHRHEDIVTPVPLDSVPFLIPNDVNSSYAADDSLFDLVSNSFNFNDSAPVQICNREHTKTSISTSVRIVETMANWENMVQILHSSRHLNINKETGRSTTSHNIYLNGARGNQSGAININMIISKCQNKILNIFFNNGKENETFMLSALATEDVLTSMLNNHNIFSEHQDDTQTYNHSNDVDGSIVVKKNKKSLQITKSHPSGSISSFSCDIENMNVMAEEI